MKRVNWINTPRIFIIDSNITDCQAMITTLLKASYEVDIATDGQDGLSRILARPPHCLILNVILPGINGYAICRHLRSGYHPYHTIPIIVMSTKSTTLDQNYALRMGANSYLAKPFNDDALLQAVQKVLPQFQRPTPAASQISSSSPVSVSQASAPVASMDDYSFIPYLSNEADIMLKHSPFASASRIMADQQLRRLHAAIDGQHNIQQLAEITQLDLLATLKLLKVLWQQQYIAFYDKKRHPLKEVSLFDHIK